MLTLQMLHKCHNKTHETIFWWMICQSLVYGYRGGGNTCAGDAMRSGQHGCVVGGSVMTWSNCLKLIFFNIISIMIIICNKLFCKTVLFRPLVDYRVSPILHGCAYFVFLKHLFMIWFSQSACIYWRTKVNVICTRQTCKNTEALCCSVGFVSTAGVDTQPAHNLHTTSCGWTLRIRTWTTASNWFSHLGKCLNLWNRLLSTESCTQEVMKQRSSHGLVSGAACGLWSWPQHHIWGQSAVSATRLASKYHSCCRKEDIFKRHSNLSVSGIAEHHTSIRVSGFNEDLRTPHIFLSPNNFACCCRCKHSGMCFSLTLLHQRLHADLCVCLCARWKQTGGLLPGSTVRASFLKVLKSAALYLME